MLSPIRHAFSLSVMCNEHGIPFIPRLLLGCLPSTIFWGVVAIVVYSPNRMFHAWPRPHILVKILKRIKPPIANLYSPTTVIIVRMASFIKASVFHRMPTRKFWSISHAVGCPALRHSHKFLPSYAAARLYLARFHVLPSNNFYFPAFTNATIVRTAICPRMRKLNNAKPPKRHPRYVFSFSHFFNICCDCVTVKLKF